jgi:hypothetical protein
MVSHARVSAEMSAVPVRERRKWVPSLSMTSVPSTHSMAPSSLLRRKP